MSFPPVEHFWILPCPRGLCLFHSSFPLGGVDAYQWRNKLTMGPGVQKCEWAPKQCFDFVTTILFLFFFQIYFQLHSSMRLSSSIFFVHFFPDFSFQEGSRRRYFKNFQLHFSTECSRCR